MSTDLELDRLREAFPLGSLVRTGTGLVDRGVHEVIGHERMHPPYCRPALLLRTPDGDTARGTPDMWRIDEA